MKSEVNSKFKLIFSLLAALFVSVCASSAQAQSFGVSPGRIELEVKAGGERTTVLVVDYGKEADNTAEMPNIRVIARAEDWNINPNGELLTGAAGTQPRTATDWMIFSPAEFTIAPGTKQPIRVTISVPAGTKPGDYYTALYLEDRNPPPPPKENNPQLNIRYRFYSLIYVMVPDLTRKGEIAGLQATTDDKGKTTVSVTLKNTGNSHMRGTHSVEIRDENDRVVAEIPKKEATVLLGDSEMTLKLELEKPLPAGKYKVTYMMDFGKAQSIQVGKTMLEVAPSSDPSTKESPTAPEKKPTPSAESAPQLEMKKTISNTDLSGYTKQK